MSHARTRRLRTAAALAVLLVLAALLPACSLFGGGTSGYDLHATFSEAIGLYPGSPVRILGIDAGKITDVTNSGNHVNVTMRIDSAHKVPVDATATIVPESLIGERYVQLSPVYTGGASLAPDAVIRHTSVPTEFDALLRGLQNFTGAIKPQNAAELITRLSELLAGQGKNLNDLLHNGAQTLQLLADKGGELGDIIDSLSRLSTTLQAHTSDIQELIANYQRLSQVLANSSGDLSDTITNLDSAAVQLADLLEQHAGPLQFDLAQLTTASRTLDRNFDSLATTLASTVKLFQGAGRAYDDAHQSIRLNQVLDPGLSGSLIASRLRDRVAGLCRRLDGLLSLSAPTAVLGQQLGEQCANPDSSFLNQFVAQIPTLLSQLPGAASSPTAPPGSSGAKAATPAPQPTAPSAGTTQAIDPNQLSLQMLAQLFGSLTPAQASAVKGLNLPLLQAIGKLTPDELSTLTTLSPDQLNGLVKVSPDKLATTLDQIRFGSLDAQTLLDPTLSALPGSGGSAGVQNLLNAVLNAAASLGGGS